jgi:hypothetical protein
MATDRRRRTTTTNTKMVTSDPVRRHADGTVECPGYWTLSPDGTGVVHRAGVRIHRGPTPPPAPAANDLWIAPDDHEHAVVERLAAIEQKLAATVALNQTLAAMVASNLGRAGMDAAVVAAPSPAEHRTPVAIVADEIDAVSASVLDRIVEAGAKTARTATTRELLERHLGASMRTLRTGFSRLAKGYSVGGPLIVCKRGNCGGTYATEFGVAVADELVNRESRRLSQPAVRLA